MSSAKWHLFESCALNANQRYVLILNSLLHCCQLIFQNHHYVVDGPDAKADLYQRERADEQRCRQVHSAVGQNYPQGTDVQEHGL